MYKRASERASASVCVRADAAPSSRSQWTEPATPPPLRGSSDSEGESPTDPASSSIYLSHCLYVVCMYAAVRACFERVFHFGRFGWSRRPLLNASTLARSPPPLFTVPGRPSFIPSSLPPSLPRALLFGESVFQPLAAAAASPTNQATNRGLQWMDADSNAVAATLAGRHSTIWCSEPDHLTQEPLSSLDRPQRRRLRRDVNPRLCAPVTLQGTSGRG